MERNTPQPACVPATERAITRSPQPAVHDRKAAVELALTHGVRQVDFTGGQRGEAARIGGQQAVHQRRSTTEITDDEQRFADHDAPVPGKQERIQQPKEPRRDPPDQEQDQNHRERGQPSQVKAVVRAASPRQTVAQLPPYVIPIEIEQSCVLTARTVRWQIDSAVSSCSAP